MSVSADVEADETTRCAGVIDGKVSVGDFVDDLGSAGLR